MLRLKGGNMRNGSEDISAVGSGSFNTVSGSQPYPRQCQEGEKKETYRW